ncbi:hypothetical protein Tco_0568982 [Tanacetum coccineum]
MYYHQNNHLPPDLMHLSNTKGKEIAKPITPLSELASEEDSDPKQAQRDKDMQKNLALIAKYFKKIYKPTNNNLKTSSNSRNKNVDTYLRYKNDNQTGQFRNQRTITLLGLRRLKPKRVKDYTYHKEKMLMCKEAEKGVPLQGEQADSLANTDEEIDEQELEAHYSYMAKIQEIAAIEQDPDISLVQHDVEIQGRYGHDTEFNFDFDAAKEVSTIGAAVTTASVVVSTVSPTRNTRVSTTDDITMAETLVYIRKSVAKDKEWEEIQARVQADEELVQRLQAEEREKYTEAEQARMLAELINQRKRYFAAQRAEERRNKPPTQAQQRTYMSNYIKNMGGYTLQQLRGYSFDEIKTLFETTMRKVNTFVPIESEVDRAVPELAAGSSKRAAEEELDQESSKRQKTGESSELAEEPRDKEADELSQEELQQMMIIVPEQGMNVEALQTKYPIIDWEIYTEGTRKYWKIIRVGNHTEEKFNSTEPIDDKEREIWVELKRLFEPNIDDELWKLQKHIHYLTWKLYDSCEVHHVSTEKGIDIYMLVEKELKDQEDEVFGRIFLDLQVMIITATGYVSTAGEDCWNTLSTDIAKITRKRSKTRQTRTQERIEYTRAGKFLAKTLAHDVAYAMTWKTLNVKTSNVNFVCVTCGKCMLNDNHDMCVLNYINGVNSRTRQQIAVPISTRKPKHDVNQSAATSHKKTVATDSTVKKPRNSIRTIYEQVSKTCSWWYPKFTPPRYEWKPKSSIENVNLNVSMPLGNESRSANISEHMTPRCSKHMTGNLKLLTNFVEKFLGTVKFGNDQIAPILGYGDLVQGAITLQRVYYVERLNHNLFSVGQFCDADSEVAFRKSSCYIRDLKGNDLLTGSRGTDLYSISLQDTSTPNPICLMAKATSS